MALTPRLYHDGELVTGGEFRLSPQTSHHLARVLRAAAGDTIELFNGNGRRYAATLTTIDRRACSVRIDSHTLASNRSPLHTTLLQGLSRNDRMDTTLQKATELGVDRIVPVICARSRYQPGEDRAGKKLAHWQQVIISACEQSGRCTLPELTAPLALRDALAITEPGALALVLAPQGADTLSSIDVAAQAVSLLIGPESGLEANELEAALATGYRAVRFGPRILRTETAGPAALACVQLLWGDLGR
jgi:16S rRNA (uracil1498-N3)-methyltransferase